MKIWKMVDYTRLSVRTLNTPEYSHLRYLVFWPLFGIAFLIIERLWIRENYYAVSCWIDSQIPFCEFFLPAYLFWFVFLVGMHIYALLFDVEAFKRLMRFIIITYTAAMLVYVIFPNCQELRPNSFERDNIFTRFMSAFYRFDTNTNVCPSLHVIGSFAVLFCAWHSELFSTPKWRAAFLSAAIIISMSTVFLKQHSILDVLAAIPICALGYIVVYRDKIGTSPNREK